jgi:hypothetical protein
MLVIKGIEGHNFSRGISIALEVTICRYNLWNFLFMLEDFSSGIVKSPRNSCRFPPSLIYPAHLVCPFTVHFSSSFRFLSLSSYFSSLSLPLVIFFSRWHCDMNNGSPRPPRGALVVQDVPIYRHSHETYRYPCSDQQKLQTYETKILYNTKYRRFGPSGLAIKFFSFNSRHRWPSTPVSLLVYFFPFLWIYPKILLYFVIHSLWGSLFSLH